MDRIDRESLSQEYLLLGSEADPMGKREIEQRLFELNRILAVKYARRFSLRHRLDFSDCLSDAHIALLRAIRSPAAFKVLSFSAFASAAIRNALSNLVRTERSRRHVSFTDDISLISIPERQSVRAWEILDRVDEFLADDPRGQQLFRFRRVGLRNKEIGQLLGLRHDIVKMRLVHRYAKIRRHFGPLVVA